MKYLYIFLIYFLLGCTPSWYSLGNMQLVKYNIEMTVSQFDSLCIADELSNNLSNWKTIPLVNDGIPIERFMYIKDKENLYIITIQDSIYTVTKRIIIQ